VIEKYCDDVSSPLQKMTPFLETVVDGEEFFSAGARLKVSQGPHNFE
jgi:hypothetical protein